MLQDWSSISTAQWKDSMVNINQPPAKIAHVHMRSVKQSFQFWSKGVSSGQGCLHMLFYQYI